MLLLIDWQHAQCRWAAYPPEPAKLDDLFELGYRDTLNWLKENKKIDPSGMPAGSQSSIQSTLSESQTDSPRGSQTDSQSGSPSGRSQGAGDRFSYASDAESIDGQAIQAEPLWRKMSCEAPSCDETFKEAFVGELFWLTKCLVWHSACCVCTAKVDVTHSVCQTVTCCLQSVFVPLPSHVRGCSKNALPACNNSCDHA